jgi:hypothetical protein
MNELIENNNKNNEPLFQTPFRSINPPQIVVGGLFGVTIVVEV